MYSLLLAVIYLAFISLGFPDSLLGAGWPVMHSDLNVPISYAGVISTIIACGTIVSSLLSDYITKKLSPGLVTAISVLVTAVAMFGFSVSHSFIVLCILAIPYGLGAGAIDAALNNYVALNYSSRHMSWLHACWGVGISVSPYVMGYCLTKNLGWNMGYRFTSYAQIILTIIVFMSLPLWKNKKTDDATQRSEPVSLKQAINIKGVKYCLLGFFAFCAFEATAGLWASTFMVEYKGIDVETAARFASLFFIGETFGRFLNGFVSDKFGDKKMINVGIWIMIAGVLLMLLPTDCDILTFAGLIIIGLGAAPVYPCIIHSTPKNFGNENSQALVGIQMASAYVGATLAPPVFGFVADNISLSLYPWYLGIFALTMLIAISKMNNILKK